MQILAKSKVGLHCRDNLLGALGLELSVEGVAARNGGNVNGVPVAVTEGSAAAKSNGEVKDESLAQLSGDSRYSSDRHCDVVFLRRKRRDGEQLHVFK